MPDEYLTVEQVAEKLQLHPKTVRKLFREKAIPGRQIGREWRTTADALKAYIEGTQPPKTGS